MILSFLCFDNINMQFGEEKYTDQDILLEKPVIDDHKRSISLGGDVEQIKKQQKKRRLETAGSKDLETDGSEIPEKMNHGPPPDKGNLAYYIMVLFGIAALLPWSAVLTSLDFFD
jgi:hypothetical protein